MQKTKIKKQKKSNKRNKSKKSKNISFRTAFLIICFAAVILFANHYIGSHYVAPILMYHNIDEKADNLSVPGKSFEKQMKFLKDNKYNVISLAELANLITRERRIPKRTVAITFDDGRENNFTNAYPILKKYGFTATFFVIPGHCDWTGYLTKTQIKELSDNGFEIGSHTLNDKWLVGLSDAVLIQEIAGSKLALEAITKKRVVLFSYPLGGFDQRVRLIVMKTGYLAACTTNTGSYNPFYDVYALKRVKISGNHPENMFKFWFNASGYGVWFKSLKETAKPKTCKPTKNKCMRKRY